MRAFLGIPLPAEQRAALAEAGQAFPGLRVQQPDTIHLTLRFLGEITDPRPIVDATRAVAGAHAPFELELGRLGAFPDRRRARVIWARVGRGEIQAGAVAAGIESALVPLGFPRERRAWKGHVTIGRYKDPTRPPAAAFDAERSFGVALADRVVLYQSTLTADGAIHTPVAELSLGPGK